MALPASYDLLCKGSRPYGVVGSLTATAATNAADGDVILFACYGQPTSIAVPALFTLSAVTQEIATHGPLTIWAHYVESFSTLAGGETVTVAGSAVQAFVAVVARSVNWATENWNPTLVRFWDGTHPQTGEVTQPFPPGEPAYQDTALLLLVASEGSSPAGSVEAADPAWTALPVETGGQGGSTLYHLTGFWRHLGACGEFQGSVKLQPAGSGSRYYAMLIYWPDWSSSACTLTAPTESLVAMAPGTPPTWFSIDFDFLKDGSKVAVVVPQATTTSGYGRLWVIRYDGEYPPSPAAGDPIEVESVDVITAAVLIIQDGQDERIHLFYRLGSAIHLLQCRESRDGGATWTSPLALDPGFDAGFTTNPLDGTGGDTSFSLPVCHHRSGLVLVGIGGDVGGVFNSYLLTLRRNAAGDAWEYVGKTATGALTGEGGAFQPLGDGSVVRLGVGRLSRGRKFQDTSYQSDSIDTGTTLYGENQWIDPRTGALLGVALSSGRVDRVAPPANTTIRRAYFWATALLNNSERYEQVDVMGQQFAAAGGGRYWIGLPAWGWNISGATHDNTVPSAVSDVGRFYTLAARLKEDAAGIWWFLAPRAEDGALQWRRARRVPDWAGVNWEGR